MILLTNVLIEFDQYWGINVLAGSTRSVITTDPEMWEAYHLRHYAQTAVFSSTDRLRTFISGSPNITDSSCRAVTISQLRDLSDRGARSEAEALLFVSILGSVSRTTLLETSSVLASCRGCADPIVHFFDNIYDCGNFGCFGTSNGEAVRNAVKYNVKADITNSKGQLTDIEVAGPFLTHTLGDAADWSELADKIREKTAELFLHSFVNFILAVELPLRSQERPLKAIMVSAD